MEISPVGMEDTFVIQVEAICDCDCQVEGSEGYDYNSEECDYHGHLVCGQCQCFDRPESGDRWWGRGCQCSGNRTEMSCRASPDQAVCSGRGECECGHCLCQEGDGDLNIYGEFCQCDNINCQRDRNGSVCGDHGLCDCGVCQCEVGWSGPACDCQQSVSQCLAPGAGQEGQDGRLCSGHGVCECGECDCDDGWQGEHCHHCPTCLDTCHLLAPCVECLQWGSGLLLDDWDSSSNTTNHRVPQTCLETCQLTITSYQAHSFTTDSLENMESSWYDCSHRNGSNCKYTFLYQEVEHPDQVQILFNIESVVCPEEPDYLTWIMGRLTALHSSS